MTFRGIRVATGRAALTYMLALLVLGGSGFAAPPAVADERPLHTPTTGPVRGDPHAEPFRDRVIENESRVARRVEAADAGANYSDGDGHSVFIQVSDRYVDDPEAVQTYADLLGSFLHGGEMNRLAVYIATPSELRAGCGGDALACYDRDFELMIISGDGSVPGQPPFELVVAHEYGHHVANNRSNAPWDAGDWGTKTWASYEGICPGVRRGDYFPGNQGPRYYSNPGEAFAEAFAFANYPNSGQRWEWDLARPDSGSYAAIRSDVNRPWNGPEHLLGDGRLSRSNKSDIYRVDTPLDGRLTVELDVPSGADFDLDLLPKGSSRPLEKSRAAGSRDERVRYTICGPALVRAEAYRYQGKGPYKLDVFRP